MEALHLEKFSILKTALVTFSFCLGMYCYTQRLSHLASLSLYMHVLVVARVCSLIINIDIHFSPNAQGSANKHLSVCDTFLLGYSTGFFLLSSAFK